MKKILCLMLCFLLVGCGKEIVSQDDLKKGLDNYINSEYNDNNYSAKFEKRKIIVDYDDKEYVLKYNTKKQLTFTYEVEVSKGINYEDYLAKTEILSLPYLGFVAFASTKGVEVMDANSYFVMNYLEGMFSNYEEGKYIVVDDDAEVETDLEIILASEFGEKVIDYVKDAFGKKIEIKDNENDTFTYELSSKCSDKSCKIISKVNVNSDADFTKLKGYADEVAKSNMYQDITPDSADYHIELKVGQSVKITGKNLNGYELTGMDIVEFGDEYIFKATRSGVANGYIFIGENKSRSIYVTVSENDTNEEISTKTLRIK